MRSDVIYSTTPLRLPAVGPNNQGAGYPRPNQGSPTSDCFHSRMRFKTAFLSSLTDQDSPSLRGTFRWRLPRAEGHFHEDVGCPRVAAVAIDLPAARAARLRSSV